MSSAVIDDLSLPFPQASCGGRWSLITDRVMGGVSLAAMRKEIVAGRSAIRLQGQVSLDNQGGFVQIALDLRADGGVVDARAYQGIALDVFGNDEAYNLHLRTDDVTRPWQSYRHSFDATPAWQTLFLSFDAFQAHRLEADLDLTGLRRLGIVGIGREFHADIAVANIRFYSNLETRS